MLLPHMHVIAATLCLQMLRGNDCNHACRTCIPCCSHGFPRHPLGPAALAAAAGPGRGAVQSELTLLDKHAHAGVPLRGCVLRVGCLALQA